MCKRCNNVNHVAKCGLHSTRRRTYVDMRSKPRELLSASLQSWLQFSKKLPGKLLQAFAGKHERIV